MSYVNYKLVKKNRHQIFQKLKSKSKIKVKWMKTIHKIKAILHLVVLIKIYKLNSY